MKTKPNAQNLLSRRWMQQALIGMLETKTLGEINISQLAQRAGVSRMTFYRNYSAINDVIFDYLRMEEFGLAGDKDAYLYLPRFIKCMYEFFKRNQTLFSCIEENGLVPNLYVILDDFISLRSYLLVDAYGFESRYERSALSGLFSKILLDWFSSGMKESVEEMCFTVFKIITKFNCTLQS